MQKKVTYIISNINKALAFEWIAVNLNKEKFALNFILLNPENSDLEAFLKKEKISVVRVRYLGKRNIFKAVFQVARLLKKNQTDIVHTHLFDATIVGLTAAFLAGVSRRIHTRHHSSYHHLYYPKIVKYDKMINFFSSEIVAISENVKNILINSENVSPGKIHLIHHGFDLDQFDHVQTIALEKILLKYNPSDLHPVIGVISRYTEWKGIQFIIPAFKKLLQTYPDAFLVLANAQGDYREHIQILLKNIPQKNYLQIPFENDLYSLYKLFDIFVHAPVDETVEAFGQTYVEALAANIPSVFTKSGIANEFIEHKQNAFVVPYKNSDAILDAITFYLNNKEEAKEIAARGKQDVYNHFTLEKMIHSLEELYAG
jgi:glycosyltransferase involved in cell wall biosynthesis